MQREGSTPAGAEPLGWGPRHTWHMVAGAWGLAGLAVSAPLSPLAKTQRQEVALVWPLCPLCSSPPT